MEGREWFFLMHPEVRKILNPQAPTLVGSTWEQFRNDDRIRRLDTISDGEMEILSGVASQGEVRSPREFIYILNSVRQAFMINSVSAVCALGDRHVTAVKSHPAERGA